MRLFFSMMTTLVVTGYIGYWVLKTLKRDYRK